MPSGFIQKFNALAVPVLFGFYVALLHSKKIVLITADLGRHLKNGQLLLKQGLIIKTNFYSYTEPTFPVVTHHWGSGVVFYAVWLVGGFTALSVFYSLFSGISAGIWFSIAKRLAGGKIALLASLLAIPLITYRTEIRPEVFSYLLTGVYLLLLIKYQSGNISIKFLAVTLPILQVIWVNLHVFFVFGFALVGIFLASAAIRKEFIQFRQLFPVLLSIIAISLINPFGFRGLIEPFLILREYGYMVVENQSVRFMQKRFGGFTYSYFEFLLGMLAIFWAVIFIKKAKGVFITPLLILSIGTSALAWHYIRTFPIFGYVFIISISYAALLLKQVYKIKESYIDNMVGISLLLTLWVGIGFKTVYSPWYKNRFGYGLVSGINGSADFFKKTKINGPIFNNYDIGSYLTYHMFPKERVFVDNRPEAYSVSFFQDTYIPAQTDEKKWKEMKNKYKFNAIFFYRHDATPWAQPFLIRRIEDREWIPIYVDGWAIILVKDVEKNANLIRKYQIPNDVFVTR